MLSSGRREAPPAVLAFAILVLVLLFRPQGILGKRAA